MKVIVAALIIMEFSNRVVTTAVSVCGAAAEVV